MERIDGRIIHDVYLDRVVFRETFTGDGAETEFTLSGPDAAQVTFKYGAWAVGNVKTTLPSHVTKTDKKPAYDGLVPLVRTRIAVTGIDAAGVVTLNEPPRAIDFYIWYWYDLPNHHLLENYYREDFVASMEEEATVYGVDISVDTTNFAGIFTVADNTVQKAFDTADDHIHDGRYYTETELANQTAGSEGSNLIGFHSHTLHDHLLHLTNKGVMEGCVVSDVGTLDITWTSGMIWDSANEVTMTIASGSATCENNLVNYLYADYSVSTTVLQRSTTFPTETDMVLVAIIWCQDADIWQIEHSDWMNLQLADLHSASLGLFPSWVVSGMTVSEDENADNALDVTMAAGVLYHGNHHRETIAQVDTRTTALVRHFHVGSAWDSETNAEIDTAWYDNGADKTDATGGKWFKSVFLYTEGKLHWVYPRVQYSTRAQANAAPIPAIPSGLARAAYLTAIVYGTDDSDFTTTDWIDIRVGLAEAIASAPVTNHDYLAGISADDHHAQAHKDTHDPQTGGDPLDCAAAGEIVGVAAAAEGNADTLARSNHTHQIQHSIADNHIVTVDGGANQPANTDYAAWTASGLEGRDKAQMLTFLNVADGADVTGSNAPQAHVLVSGSHTASGLTIGHFLKATGATTFAFGAHGLDAAAVGASASDHTHSFTEVNTALAAANADIDINGQDIENINQIAVGHTTPTYDIESRIADYHGVWANRVYSDTVSHTPYLYFIKSHSDTEWSSVETIDDDMLGEIKFFGMDTAPGMSAGARIYAQQVGAAGGMVPTELIIDVANDTAERSIVTFTYSEVTLGTGINLQQANADETHYLGRCAIGWIGSGNEAGWQHRSLDIDGTNYAIMQLNLGATYLNCSTGKNIYFRRNNVTITNLDELDDLTDGAETALHTHAGGDLTFTNVNAVLAAANAAIDINSQNLTGVGTVDGIDISAELATKTTTTTQITVGSGGDYTDFASAVAVIPDLIAHDYTIQILKGTTLTEACAIKNKHGITAAGQLNVVAQTYYPTSGVLPTADGADTTYLTDTSVFDTDDEYNSCWVLIVDGTGTDNGFVEITDTIAATGRITVTSWPGVEPDNTSKYVIVGALIDGESARSVGLELNYCTMPIIAKGIGVKDHVDYGIRALFCTYPIVNYCGIYNQGFSGVVFTTCVATYLRYCGIVGNNTGSSSGHAGVLLSSCDFSDVRYNGISDNDDQGIYVNSGSFAYIRDNFGDANGLWGTYAQYSGQARCIGTECTGSSGSHSHDATTGGLSY